MVWLNNWHWLPLVMIGVTLFLIGGPTMVLWGVFLRVTIGLHSTWLVNSATHLWGGQRFQTGDDSRNNWWVALLTFGEGWHNNHHAHPVSARHGLKWYEIDLNWYGIWSLKTLGLAKNVYRVKLSELRQNEPQEDKLAPAQPELVHGEMAQAEMASV